MVLEVSSMGSMTRVMQKIQAEDGGPGADDNAEVAGLPPPAAVTASEIESDSQFVTDAAEAPVATTKVAAVDLPGYGSLPPLSGDGPPPAGPDTVVWDPRRVDPVVVAFHDRYSAICEQYRSVRARLITMNTNRTPRVLAITSAIPEEGKSVSTLNLSLVMAEGGEHRIAIIDADFRRTSIARMLGISESPGLAEVLRNEVPLEEALQPTPFPNLKVLPAGNVPDGVYGELLGGPNVNAVLAELRQSFDYAFLDTPPITTVSDVCLLAPQCDGAIIVVQMRRTPEPTVQQAVRTLQANNVKVLGSILSRFRERAAGYYDHYYSSYYYR
jgi:capsular exopolysaccharide synthesis family protein